MDMRETRISGEYFFEGRIMKARVDEVRLPNGKQASREVCEHVGGVGVLPSDVPRTAEKPVLRSVNHELLIV